MDMLSTMTFSGDVDETGNAFVVRSVSFSSAARQATSLALESADILKELREKLMITPVVSVMITRVIQISIMDEPVWFFIRCSMI